MMEEKIRKHKSGKHKPREEKSVGWHDVSDEFWAVAAQYIPKPNPRTAKGGRNAADPRKLLNGMLYVLRTGCQWKMTPREYYEGSTTHKYFQRWVKEGVFESLWFHCLSEYDDLVGIDWEWQILDSQTVAAPVKKGKK